MILHSKAEIFLDPNGFVRLNICERAEFDLDDAHEFVKIFERVCDGKPRCFLADLRGTFATATPENRKFMGTDLTALRWRKADALLIDSLHIRLIGNFYMRFDTPEHPVRIFTNEEKAIEWLKKFD